MASNPLFILAFLLAVIAVSEWLVRHTRMRHLGVALLVILLTALAINLDVIPAYGAETPVYDAIFTWVAPLGIFWLLLLVDLQSVLKAGAPSLALFLVGAGGTVLGVLAGHSLVGGAESFGDLHWALAGMFTGTYIGGSVNFNAIAIEYGVIGRPSLYAGAAAVDNAMTTLWMIACVALPRLLAPLWGIGGRAVPTPAAATLSLEEETETTSIFDLALVLALGLLAVVASGAIVRGIDTALGVDIPETLVLTTLALLLAQAPYIQRLRGTRLLGLFAVYLFLAVIGTLCDVDALVAIGDLAPSLLAFVTIIVVVHGVAVFGAAWLLGFDPAAASVASQANIGGGTTALALARSLGRPELELPAILLGSIGTALGNYLGFTVAGLLG